MTKKGLLLNKAHFAINGYGMDDETYPQNTNKASSMSGKGKKKADEVMKDDLSDEDMEEEEDAIALNDNVVILESGIQECSKDEELEASSRNDVHLLVGIRLGGRTADDEQREKLMRLRFQVIPQNLFGCEGPSSQSSTFPLGREVRLT
jgi:hypothetical protein